MREQYEKALNTTLTFSFYALFFVTPFLMHPHTSELFEFNKMWFVFAMSLFIFFIWSTKAIITKKLFIRRTPFDIPIALFLLSQILATIFSIDFHVSLWGYYSRFNGGLLSTISYIFLYYAFATNFLPTKQDNKNQDQQTPFSYKIAVISLVSGLGVTLWGLPSHFGKDLTCLVFRGQLDTSCWTADFVPTLRMFSTLGQPNWLAAFLTILTPISLALVPLTSKKSHITLPFLNKLKTTEFIKNITFAQVFFALLAVFFYISLLWTRSQSGFLGFWTGMVVLGVFYLLLKKQLTKTDSGKKSFKLLIATIALFLLSTFVISTPIERFNTFTLPQLQKSSAPQPSDVPETQNTQTQQAPAGAVLDSGITNSGEIRTIVWQGAIDVFKNNMLLGTGPETFAYAYYKERPQAHNLTSEWDFLYNKAHNELLNYLATSGLLGLGSYLALLAYFVFYATKNILKKDSPYALLGASLVAGLIANSVVNFFGFSVVVTNLFLFLTPVLLYDLLQKDGFEKSINLIGSPATKQYLGKKLGGGAVLLIITLALIVAAFEFTLLRFWIADQKYALGNNLDRVNEFVQANPLLQEAVTLRPSEDVFKDKLAVNLSTLSLLFAQQGDQARAEAFAQEAKKLSDEVTTQHPNNVLYFKSRTRIMYALSQLNPAFLADAVNAIEKAQDLAPTDAKIAYNVAIMYEQQGKREEAIEQLIKTAELKPNYADAHYTLALLYQQLAEESPAEKTQYIEKAKERLNYILENLDPNNQGARDLLETL